MAKGKIRWGDTLDDDDSLPASFTRGPSEDGIKTVVEFYRNDKGEAFKKTTKIKIVKVEKKVYKISAERRSWPRFGAAKRETPDESVTVRSMEDIPFERVRQQKATSQEKKFSDFQQTMASADKQAIVGSLKDILYKKRMERELLRAKGLLGEAEKPPEEDGPKPLGLPGLKSGSYVPPSLRNRPPGVTEGPVMETRRRDENSVRVTNLSEEVTEADLHDLFGAFGHTSRIFLAVDKETGISRGFAFVNYVQRSDAERAIRTLDGHGYDNLILHVEWAAPRAERN